MWLRPHPGADVLTSLGVDVVGGSVVQHHPEHCWGVGTSQHLRSIQTARCSEPDELLHADRVRQHMPGKHAY